MSGKRGRQTVMREEYTCRKEFGGCGAQPGQSCLTRSGQLTSAHAARWDQYHGRSASDQSMRTRIRTDMTEMRSKMLTFDEWLMTQQIPTGTTAVLPREELVKLMKLAWNGAQVNVAPVVKEPWKIGAATTDNARIEYRIARVIKVVRDKINGPATLFVDGELFPYATADGYSFHPQRNEMPGVTFTLVAERVELIDSSLEKGSS